MPSADFALLRQLVEAQQESPLSLDELARTLGTSSPLLLRRLRPLVDEGLVERHERRTPTGRLVNYLPAPAVRIEWVTPALGLALHWTRADEMDWSVPLVGQIPDGAARKTLTRFINGLRARFAQVGEVFGEPALAVIAYGSTARGSARPDSDVDALVVGSLDEEAILDVAAAASIDSPRPLQIKVISVDDLTRLPRGVAQGVDASGLVVFDGLRDPRVWKRAYGRRPRDGAAERGRS